MCIYIYICAQTLVALVMILAPAEVRVLEAGVAGVDVQADHNRVLSRQAIARVGARCFSHHPTMTCSGYSKDMLRGLAAEMTSWNRSAAAARCRLRIDFTEAALLKKQGAVGLRGCRDTLNNFETDP